MKKILFIFLACLLFAPSLVLADDYSSMSFYGLAELNGSRLPGGSVVESFVNGVLNGRSVVDENGYYGEDGSVQPGLVVPPYKDGELVFKYDSRDANAGNLTVKYLGSFVPGRIVRLDLPFVYGVNVSVTPNFSTSSAAKADAENKARVLGVKIIDYSAFASLSGLSGELADAISKNEAEKIAGQKDFIELSLADSDIYDKIAALNFSKINEAEKNAIAYFIQNGTLTTQRLGAGERTGTLSSYLSAFNKIPSSTVEWQDVIKISNGRWPSQKSQSAEDMAALIFKKIYLRASDLKNKNDGAAVAIIAYGLRPVVRNMNSEKAAIDHFKHIFEKSPVTAEDWNIVRAIAYSGAKR